MTRNLKVSAELNICQDKISRSRRRVATANKVGQPEPRDVREKRNLGGGGWVSQCRRCGGQARARDDDKGRIHETGP